MPKTTVLPCRLSAPACQPAAVRLPAPAKAALILCLGALLGACASTRAPTDSGLSGHWRLDAAASDNVDAMITQALDHARKRLRHRSRGGFGGGNGTGEGNSVDQYGNVLAIGPDFAQLRQQLLDALAVPAILSLDVRPELVDIQSDSLPARDYNPGEKFTRVDEYGTAVLDSHWSGNAFVLSERYTSGASLTERYEIGRDGSLDCTRSLKDPTVGRLEIKSVYHRG